MRAIASEVRYVASAALIALLSCGAIAQASNADSASREIDRLLAVDAATPVKTPEKSVGEYASKTPPAAQPIVKKASDAVGRIGDAAYLRRVSLDLTGEVPTPNQVTAFVLDNSPDKRATVVDRLLASPAYGRNMAHYWCDVVFYRRNDERALQTQPIATEYLTEKFNRNAPWDEIARELIVAKGNVRENGALALIMAQRANAEDITSEVTRVFMGIQLQCANCHNHPTDRWKRTEFHELAAFFPRIAFQRNKPGDVKTLDVVSVDSEPPKRKNAAAPPRGSLEHYMPDLKKPESKGTRMQPVFFLTGQKLPFGSTDDERRETIAKWITSAGDPWFAKAFVNRIWAELGGEGFYQPVDDLGPDRPCTAPQTMQYLADQFTAHQFDVKWLVRTIVLTDAYQREVRSRETGAKNLFVSNCPQRLRSDQLFDSLASVLALRDLEPKKTAKADQIRGQRMQFAQVFGYDPSLSRDELSGSIPQALAMMNAPQINAAINGQRRNTTLGKLLTSSNDDTAVIDELYLRCLGRQPKKPEVTTCLAHINASANRAEGMEDILWALLNSAEFIYRN